MIKGTKIFFAGQISGVEGYVESIASGLVSALNACSLYNEICKSEFNNSLKNVSKLDEMILKGEKIVFDKDTIIGSLADYISTVHEDFQPMNANFGLFNTERRFKSKQEKYEFYD